MLNISLATTHISKHLSHQLSSKWMTDIIEAVNMKHRKTDHTNFLLAAEQRE
jgi:hypothetical protein